MRIPENTSKAIDSDVFALLEKVVSAQQIIDIVDSCLNADIQFDEFDLQRAIGLAISRISDCNPYAGMAEEYIATKREFVYGIVKKLSEEGNDVLFNNDDLAQEDYNNKVARFKQLLLAPSPNIFDCIGSIEDSVDLLVLLEECPALMDAFRFQLGNVVYTLSFAHGNKTIARNIAEHLQKISIADQIKAVGIMRNISNYAANDMYDTSNVQKILYSVTEQINDLPVLVDIFITSLANVTDQRLREYEDIEDEIAELTASIRTDETELASQLQLKQDSLRPCYLADGVIGARDAWGGVVGMAVFDVDSLSELSENQKFIVSLLKQLDFSGVGDGSITPFVVKWINAHLTAQFITNNGLLDAIDVDSLGGRNAFRAKITELLPIAKNLEIIRTKDFIMDKYPSATVEQIELYSLLQRPEIRSHIELSLGNFDITELSFEAQLHLLSYMASKKYEEFYSLTDIVDSEKIDKKQFLEAFLALEFGDDYGESLLTIAEKAKPEQTNEIASIIGEYRKLSARFGELFEGYNLELAKSVEVSINEKCTDILVAIEEILVKGSIEVEVMKGVYADFDSINEAIETMYDLLISLRQIVNILNSKLMSVDIAEQGDGYKIFRLSDKDNGNILAYIRPHGSKTFDEAVEYGRPGQGVEASINFKVNPLDPFEPLSPSKDMGAVSLRLDREGISENDSWDAPHRDPTRNEGMVSLDVSAQFGKENSPEVKIARLIASGNKIRYGRGVSGAQDTLHHTNRQFDQESFGTAEGFADVARYIQEIIESRLKSSSLSRLSSLLVKNG